MKTDIEKSIATILLIEDNPGDVRLIQEVFRECNVSITLVVESSGIHAMNRIKQKGDYRDTPKPDLVLLDLNMPEEDGFDVLSRIKTDKDILHIPVIVLSSSTSKKDINKAYTLHANCYISKPSNYKGYISIMKTIEDFWLTLAKLPGA